uniref:Phosphoglycerate kinase n=1 Tax=Arcella intermedia TaxID=1963864 RepID=A0A6B2L5E6_9EUKA
MSISNKLSIEDLDLKDKRVLIRVDFNVPLHKEDGHITNSQRIEAALPTLKYALEKGAKTIILMSHLGRPDGRRNPKESLAVVAPKLQELIGRPVTFLDDCIGEAVEKAVSGGTGGQIFLLENLRFHAEEEGSGKDQDGKTFKPSAEEVKKFRESLTRLGDVFVNDAFGTAHRAHSSMVGVALQRGSGFLMKKELEFFGKVLENPTKPRLAILGGAKVSDKIKIIFNLLDKIDRLIIGGGMSFTFEKVLHNTQIGKSLFDQEGSKIVNEIVNKAKEKGVELFLPVDWVAAEKFDKNAQHKVVARKDGVPEGWMGLDIGPETRKIFNEVVLSSKTILWNGPMGVFEFPAFAQGTKDVMDALVEVTKTGATTVIGGGDSAACAAENGIEDKVGHVSTGGGASMELLEGRDLPGVTALTDKK